MKHPLDQTGRVTKRLVMCLIGCTLIWWFMHVHRDWVWAYFATLQGYKTIPPELAAVAAAGITSITTIAITGITGVVAVVLFLVTGNVAVLRAFQFASIGQASASVTSDTASQFSHEVIDQTTENIIREFGTPELQERYKDR